MHAIDNRLNIADSVIVGSCISLTFLTPFSRSNLLATGHQCTRLITNLGIFYLIT